ncbi:transposase [Streptomyces sioyaensis]|uniref:transposase n=1 Tax=Streptomyces sioyaensis TaxID=67364 RepID=UPI0037D61305
MLAVGVSNWLCPDAPTSNDRLFCHGYGRGDRTTDQLVPGWPYSFVAALETGHTSWVALLDAVRLTAAQLRNVAKRLTRARRRDRTAPGCGSIRVASCRVSDQRTVTWKTGETVVPLTMRRSFLPFRPSWTHRE